MADIDLIEFVHQQGIDALPLQVGTYRDQEHFDRVIFPQSPQQMNKTEWEEPSPGLLKGFGQGGKGDAEGCHPVLPVQNN